MLSYKFILDEFTIVITVMVIIKIFESKCL